MSTHNEHVLSQKLFLDMWKRKSQLPDMAYKDKTNYRQSQVQSMDDIKPRSRPKSTGLPFSEVTSSNFVNTTQNTPAINTSFIGEKHIESPIAMSPQSAENINTPKSRYSNSSWSKHIPYAAPQYNSNEISKKNSVSSPTAFSQANGGWGQIASVDKTSGSNSTTSKAEGFNNDRNVTTNDDNMEPKWSITEEDSHNSSKYGNDDHAARLSQSQANTFALTSNGNLIESSITAAPSARSRTRDLTIDSVGTMKITSTIGEFDDFKSEAISSWDAGLDLKLDSHQKAKKKSEWLSQSDFFSATADEPKPTSSPAAVRPSYNDMISPSAATTATPRKEKAYWTEPDSSWVLYADNDQKAQQTSTTWDSVPVRQDHTSSSIQLNGSWDHEWHEEEFNHSWQRKNTADRWKRTNTEAADTNTPDWALNEVRMTPSTAQEGRSHQFWTLSQPQAVPMAVIPSPFIQTAPDNLAPSPRDTKALQTFHSFIHNHDLHNTTKFQKQYEKYMTAQIHEFSPRTLAKFFEATAFLINYEISPQVNKAETARHIRHSWNNFIFYLLRHLQMYASLPEDILSVLSICANLIRYTPTIYKDMPVAELVRVFELVKPICTPEAEMECLKYLRMLKALPNDMHWRDTDERLPTVPTAESIVSEVVNQTNVLLDYESKKEIEIKNKIKNPWPNVDLLNYTLIHFMMLREEFSKPLQETLSALFSDQFASKEIPHDCAIYEGALARSTTMILSSSDPAIVFNLAPHVYYDNIMESFQEGSLIILLPEHTTKIDHADHHGIMMKMAKGAMLGHAVRASSSKKGHMIHHIVSIHINKQDLERLDWNATYTIITSRVNAAATLSILTWLHKVYVDLKKERFSPVLTPRILVANNILSAKQLVAWDKENTESARLINQDAVPDYLVNAEIDVSCIIAKGANGRFKARPGEGVWPRHAPQWESVAAHKRPPLYNLSPSQVSAVQFTLCHRIAVIAGAPGTGKTFIAAKLAQLMTEALVNGQFHQPVLIMTKTQSSLDNILTRIVPQIPDVVRFGGQPWDANLINKQATRLAVPTAADSNYRQHQNLERQLTKNQIKLNALLQARFQASHHDPAVLSTAIAPQYLQHLQDGFIKKRGGIQSFSLNVLAVWNEWAAVDDKTVNYHLAQASQTQLDHAQWTLETNYLKRAGRGLMPMMESTSMQSRFSWVAKNPISVSSIVDSINWPFENSAHSGHSLRSALFDVWSRIPAARIWDTTNEERIMLIDAIAKVLVNYLDFEIHDVLQDQIKTAKAFDENLVQKWTYLCRFNRVIGMTSDFAAANHDWASTLWPRAIIIDEASEILESSVASTIFGFRTEHVVMLGNGDSLSKPHLSNPEMTGNPRNLDVSLFERWKGTNGDMVHLEEQHRMHSEVADVIDKFNSIKSKSDSLLITAPLFSCNENMVDGNDRQFEKMYGITQRAFYVDYQAGSNTSRNVQYLDALKANVTEAEVDEARYVAFFAVYLSQQLYPLPQITILTTCLLQKYLIRCILREEVPKRTCFKSNVEKISLDTIEQNDGREDAFTIISTATPGSSSSTYDNISRALPRAKYGLFVIGKPDKDNVHPRWKDFAKYMQDRELFGQHLRLTCHTHGDTFTVGHWQDFDQMRNGGCSRLCKQLMSDGHVCQETCHFMTHDEIVCMEPCTRIRPSNCTHSCKKLCHECKKNGFCPPCEEKCLLKLNCGHEYEDACHALMHKSALQCQEIVEIDLKCGHKTLTECYKTKRAICDITEERQLYCGHVMMIKCGTNPVCAEPCKVSLECGHACLELCGVDHDHDRSKCLASCPKQLLCGHGCANGCSDSDRHTMVCMEKCNYLCFHGYNCSRECFKECIRCVSACPYKCQHFTCKKKCHEVCDRPPCNKPCKVRFNCSHTCSGLCGEPCPPCTICNTGLKCCITLRDVSEFDEDEKVYMLPDCGCVYSVEVLDLYFENQAKNGNHTAIKLWECPQCQKTIYRAFRYNKCIKTEIALINTIKIRLEKERVELSEIEKNQIISAMNSEITRNHNLVGGRWFVCPNNHPYYIGDCGGATEVSTCPECNAPIGGTQHKVVESNRFFGEFDGSNAPAWPGQPGAP